jgi:hypothetical protein
VKPKKQALSAEEKRAAEEKRTLVLTKRKANIKDWLANVAHNNKVGRSKHAEHLLRCNRRRPWLPLSQRSAAGASYTQYQ